ncbi:MAG: tail fiber domain-containing protein [Nitratireductor sp.]|uniref:tail fiber domain-containing protein n=1 Tax=Nitratireductor sp. TaxID=1872084 RepID=UPI00261F9365|nr:tail fiber domain-containing protein [Nitratireductor sp.]MCV0350202.1 tail fiber domain-containing protein [Nitratireductor sp.]
MEDVITIDGGDADLLLHGKPIGEEVLKVEGTGPQGPKGNKGEKGDKGAELFHVTSVPAGTIGRVGDFALQDNGDVFEKTGETSWVLRFNTIGPKGDKGDQGIQGIQGIQGDQGIQGIQGEKGDKGEKGAELFHVTSAPGTSIGRVGDFALQENGDVFEKIDETTWTLRFNIIGPKGDKGDQGIQGIQGEKGDKGAQIFHLASVPDPAVGRVGDFVLQDNGDVFEKTDETTWLLRFNITGPKGDKGDQGEKGDKGDQGDKGEKGEQGAQLIHTTTAPDPTEGNIGDFAIQNNGDIFQKTTANTWAFLFNTVGPKGDKGDPGDKGEKGDQGEQGPPGPGSGDMLASTYDTNGDGKVDAADSADQAPWGGITDKPATFPSDPHGHTIAEVGDLQAELDAKAPLNSPSLTGTPVAPTAPAGTNNTQVATTAFVQAIVNELVNGAPGTLDTLQELATALGDDPNFATTITNQIAGKAPLEHTHPWADVTGKPSSYPPATHTHTIANITGLQAALNAKQDTLGYVPLEKQGPVVSGGYFEIRPYNTSYDDGSRVRSFYDGNNRTWKIYVRDSEGISSPLDIELNSKKVWHTGNLNPSDFVPLVQSEGARDVSPMGIYDSSKISQIWSMGAAYRTAADGSDFGNLYGLAYKHTNNPSGGTMAGGHQMVWMGNGTPQCALGTNIWTAGNVTAYSDARLKENIKPIKNALGGVLSLDGCTFDRVDTGAHQLGVLAQQVLEVFPQLVDGDENGYSVAYGNFAGVFIEAFKEEDAKVEKLKTELKETQETLASVMSRLEELEKRHGVA